MSNLAISQDRTLTRRKLLTWASQAAILSAGSLLFAGCGGGGGGGRGGSDPAPQGETGAGKPGDPVSDVQRMAALNGVLAEFERLCDGAISCSSRAIADFMLKMPAFQRVAIMPDGCVWGHFTDGQHYVVGNNLSAGSGGPRPVQSNPSAKRGISQEPFTGVPASDKGYSFSGFVNFAYPDGPEGEVDLYDSFFRRAGYDVPSRFEVNASLDTLKTMPELGFFNWFTHGGMLNQNGGLTHALMVEDVATPLGLVHNLVDLQAGNLIYYLGIYGFLRGKWRGENRFAITPQFITSYNWRFSADSVVLIHACASDNPGFRAAFKQAGAALYGGWSKPVWVHSAADAMHWMLNYFIASNVPVPTPDPRHRAYDYQAIKDYCDENEVTIYNDPTEGGEVAFNFTKFRGEPGGVAPSITHVIVQEHLGQILIRGSFGAVSGKVLIGTAIETDPQGNDNFLPWRPGGNVTELEIIDWSPDEITAEIPPTGPGSAGYLGVRVGNRWGNTRALTRWTGKLQIIGDGYGTLALNSELFFSFRADIGSVRNGPGEPILQPDTAFAATAFEAPSSWKWHAEGSNSATFPGPSTVKVDWSGDGEVKVPVTPDPGAQEFIVIAGTLSRKNHEVRLMATGGDLLAMDTKMVITDPNGSQTLTSKQSIGLPALLMQRDGESAGIRMTLNEDFSIAPGILQSEEATVLPMADNNPKFAYTVSWAKIESEYDPHPKGGI